MELAELKERYPDRKPVCFNYMQAREDILLLCDMVERQAACIYALEAQINKIVKQSERWTK